jgi:hypothetical protein
MVGYERHSETERVFIHNDGLINQSGYKIQSTLIRNYKERQTKPYNADFDGDKL